jgi:hypothetical protein
LHVPAAVIKAKSAPYLSRGKPARRNPMINEDDYSIVGRLGGEYWDIAQYYLLTPSTMAKMAARYKPR